MNIRMADADRGGGITNLAGNGLLGLPISVYDVAISRGVNSTYLADGRGHDGARLMDSGWIWRGCLRRGDEQTT